MDYRDLKWMEEIRDSFVSNQSNQFLLTGNVSDANRCPWLEKKDRFSTRNYVSVTDYLLARLSKTKRLIITYNIARGIKFPDKENREAALELYLSLFSIKEKKLGFESFNDVLTGSVAYIFPSLVFLHKLCQATHRLSAEESISIAIIIEYTDTILPNRPIAQMADSDRQRLVFFKEWLTEESFVRSSHLLFLVSETASAINESIRSLPHMVHVNIPLPDDIERRRFISWCLRANSELRLSGSQKSFAQLSAGMTLLGIKQTMVLAQYRRRRLTHDDFIQYLNRLLVNQIGDYIEIVQPAHSMKQVIGNSALKKQLKRLAVALELQKKDIAPTGMLITGPNGVGKTFITLAWAGECRRIVLMLKNLRSSYFGETDQIFEKVRNVLQVLGNVIIIVDEADTVFAKPGPNTHATEQRLFGNVTKMMGDPENRSRIVWVLLTARPDNLAPDFKRSGRCGLHLPIFDPEGGDRLEFINNMLNRCYLPLSGFKPEQKKQFMNATRDYSPADFREMVSELKMAAATNGSMLTPELCIDALKDFMPGDVSLQRRLQTLQAFLHCSRRSLIPQSMKALSKADVAKEVAELERKLASR